MSKLLRLPQTLGLVLVMVCFPVLSGHSGSPSQKAPTKLKLRAIPADNYGIHNLYRITDTLYSGSEPHGEAAFRKLADLGVKVIVSVDGARPQVKLARKHGIRYVHIPIGYDGISKHAGASLTRVIREANGPVYFHCHHGKHRGPAATAIACIAAGVANNQSARDILTTVGTSKDYAGLWRDVAAFVPPNQGQALPELVEVAEVESLAAAMAKLDRQFDRLQLCEKADWKTPPTHPDLVPAQEALQLQESFTESARLLSKDYPRPVRQWMSESAEVATRLRMAITEKNQTQATMLLGELNQTCHRCHDKYRN